MPYEFSFDTIVILGLCRTTAIPRYYVVVNSYSDKEEEVTTFSLLYFSIFYNITVSLTQEVLSNLIRVVVFS